MKIRCFEASVHLPALPHDVFAFHQSPRNIGKIAGAFPRIRVRKAAEQAKVGDRFELWLDAKLLTVCWVGQWVRVELDRLLVDRAEVSPFAWFEHEHWFYPEEDGTRMVDRVHFTFGEGIFDAIINEWAVLVLFPLMFEERHHRTVAWFSGEARFSSGSDPEVGMPLQ